MRKLILFLIFSGLIFFSGVEIAPVFVSPAKAQGAGEITIPRVWGKVVSAPSFAFEALDGTIRIVDMKTGALVLTVKRN